MGLRSGIRDPGSGKAIPDPGSMSQKGNGSRIWTRNPVYKIGLCINHCFVLSRIGDLRQLSSEKKQQLQQQHQQQQLQQLVSPRKKSRRVQHLQRPCLDFEKMQQVIVSSCLRSPHKIIKRKNGNR
jgi:hypothetical protein